MLSFIQTVEKTLAAFLVFCILGLTTLQVVARYGMGSPFTWTEELSRFSLIALTFVGSALVMARGGHIVVDLNPESDSGFRRYMNVVARLLTLAGCLFLSFTGLINARAMSRVGSSATGFPLSILYYIMCIGLAVMAFHVVVFIVQGREPERGSIRGV